MDTARFVFERLDGSTWSRAESLDFGVVPDGSSSSEIEMRVRNRGPGEENVGIVLAASSGERADDLATILQWGLAGDGVEIRQLVNPTTWGPWSSFQEGVGDEPDYRVLLSRHGIDPTPPSADGEVPRASTARFQLRASVPSGLSSTRVRVGLAVYYG